MGFTAWRGFGFIALTVALQPVLQAQDVTINWALAANAGRFVHAPDARVFQTVTATIGSFRLPVTYTQFESLLGVSAQDLARADMVTFARVDVTAPVGHWESSRWAISDTVQLVTFDFDETQAHGGNPYTFATGVVAGSVYQQYFNISIAVAPEYSFTLVDLPTGFNAFAANLEIKSGNAVGLPGEGTPSIDAAGVVPEPSSLLFTVTAGLATVRARRRHSRREQG